MRECIAIYLANADKLHMTARVTGSSGIDVRDQRVYILIGHFAPGPDQRQRAARAGRGGPLPLDGRRRAHPRGQSGTSFRQGCPLGHEDSP